MLERVLNGENPYKFDDGEDWSHEIPPLELCQNLPLWDIRIMGKDDFKYDYGNVTQTDDGMFDYGDLNDPDWKPTEAQYDLEGGEEPDHGEYTDDFDLDEMAAIDDNPYEYLLVDIDGGEEPVTEPFTDEIDFCTLLYNIPEEYANIYSVTVYCIATILEEEIIKKTGDYKAKFEIHKNDYPEADAYMYIHIGINPRMHKVYVEFMENRILKELMGTDRFRLGEIIGNQLNQFFTMTHHNHTYNVEIIVPEDRYTYCCDSSYLATCHTVHYWRSFYDHYVFLEDREEVKLDFAKKPGCDRREFYNQVKQLNIDYQMDETKHSLIPEVYNRYRQIYQDFFGYRLPDFYEAHVQVAVKYDVLYREDAYNADIVKGEDVA